MCEQVRQDFSRSFTVYL